MKKKKASEVLAQGKFYTLEDMAATFPTLTAVKKMILEARATGKSFWEIESEDDIRHFADRVIIQVSAITGDELPSSELLAKAITEEIAALLTDFGYDEFTLAEIVLAARLNYLPTLRNPAGNDFVRGVSAGRVSISFLSQVFFNYKILRNFMETEFENKIKGF